MSIITRAPNFSIGAENIIDFEALLCYNEKNLTEGDNMNVSIGGHSISFSEIKDSVSSFLTKAASKILHKDLSGYTYDGGWSLIADFLHGDKVKLASDMLGIEVSDNDFVLNSSTGKLTIADSRDKLIDFSDGYGNTGFYAYVAGNAGVVDGRAFVNFEVIVGADNQSNNLIAGYGGSQLWGGIGFSADILTGGLGIDNFIIGKNDGSDYVAGAGSDDTVSLYDVSLSDIVATAVSDNQIAVALNTGFVVTVENSDSVTPAFQLSDGTSYRYNRSTAAWQSA